MQQQKVAYTDGNNTGTLHCNVSVGLTVKQAVTGASNKLVASLLPCSPQCFSRRESLAHVRNEDEQHENNRN